MMMAFSANFPAVRSQIDYFATLLGPPFESPQPLQPIAGPSRPVVPAGKSLVRKPSNSMLKPGMPSNRRVSAVPPPAVAEVLDTVPWYDVSDGVLEALQTDLQRGIEERVQSSTMQKWCSADYNRICDTKPCWTPLSTSPFSTPKWAFHQFPSHNHTISRSTSYPAARRKNVLALMRYTRRRCHGTSRSTRRAW